MRVKSILIIILLSIVLIALDVLGFVSPVKGIVSEVVEPVQIGFYRLSKKIQFEIATITEIGKIRDKNRDLEYNLALIQAENAMLKKLEEENRILKDQLGVTGKSAKLIQTQAVGFSSVGSDRFMVVDKGSKDRVKKDNLVILRDILIGKIDTAGPVSSNVALLTNPKFIVPVVTSQKSKGLLVGQYHNEMRLTKVLPEEKLEVGDVVMTSGEAGFPKRLVTGRIEKVLKSDKEIFQEAQVKPLLNLEKLETVFILE